MLDFEEEYLISLCIEYRYRFEYLNKTMVEAELSKEYGRGGVTLHRGFYCPSPVEDIILGGSDRGRLVRTLRSSTPVDYVYQKAGDKLRIVDIIDNEKENTSRIHRRELIVYREAEEIALTYDMVFDLHDLRFLSLCRYDSTGKIMKYLTLLPNFLSRGGKYTVENKSCVYYGEQYSYNDETGLLESIIMGGKFNDYVRGHSYRFYHDETGRLISYQDIETGTLREIAKRKRRMV